MAKRAKRWMSDAFPERTRGAFGRKAKKAGMSTKRYARRVMRDQGKYDTHTIRQANAAKTGAAISRRRAIKRRK